MADAARGAVCVACGSSARQLDPVEEGLLSTVRDVLARNTLRKLYARGRIRQESDFDVGKALGKGTFGMVVEMRKKAGGALFAAKLFDENKVSLNKLTFGGVLSELRALLRVNAGWQASDLLDDKWCPLVQLHGLFVWPRVGLLMENYGISVYQMLREKREREGFDEFNEEHSGAGYVTIASNVASACRFLHDMGFLHRDLKDANVLVNKRNNYKAKLTDFGTSQRVRQVLADLPVGTIHAMAPEALAASPPGASGNAYELRAVDIYAFGIFLQALWDEGRDPYSHLSQEVINEVLMDDRWVGVTEKEQKRLVVFKHITANVKRWPDTEGYRPPPGSMLPQFVELYEQCVRLKPEQRPSFWTICNKLKAIVEERRRLARVASQPDGWQPDQSPFLRVTLTISYNPVVLKDGTAPLTLHLTSEFRSSLLKPSHVATATLDEERNARLVFVFAARAAETLQLRFTGVSHMQDPANPGADAFALLPKLTVPVPRVPQPGEAAAELPPVVLHPDWAALRTRAGTPDTNGTPTSVFVHVLRPPPHGTVPLERSLGVLTLLLGPDPTLLRLPSRSRGGIVQLPPPLAPEEDFDVVLSYRDTDTGVSGSNFVFRLQEALEAKRYRVFCYANLHVGKRWQSPFLHGVGQCRVFMPICSPEYGDLEAAPWGAAELLHAAALNKTYGGVPAILPVFHSGKAFPPNDDTAAVLDEYRSAVVPATDLYIEPARSMAYRDIFTVVLDALERALAAQEADFNATDYSGSSESESGPMDEDGE